MAANCALYPHNWAVWGGFNKINKLTGRPPPAPEARGGQSLTKDQFVIAWTSALGARPRKSTRRECLRANRDRYEALCAGGLDDPGAWWLKT